LADSAEIREPSKQPLCVFRNNRGFGQLGGSTWRILKSAAQNKSAALSGGFLADSRIW